MGSNGSLAFLNKMNIPPFIPILASFSVAFGLTVWWKGSTPSAGLPPGLPPQPSLALQMPGDVPVPPPQPQELAALLALPLTGCMNFSIGPENLWISC